MFLIFIIQPFASHQTDQPRN